MLPLVSGAHTSVSTEEVSSSLQKKLPVEHVADMPQDIPDETITQIVRHGM